MTVRSAETGARGAGRECDRDDAIGARRKRTWANIVLRKVAFIRTCDPDAGNVQRGGSRVGESHVKRAVVADRHRPEMQAAWVVASLGINHVRRQAYLLRASGSIVINVERGGKCTDVAGKEDYADDATLPYRQRFGTEVHEGEVSIIGPAAQGQ